MTMTSNSMSVCRGADQNLKDIKKYPKIEGDKRPLSHQQKKQYVRIISGSHKFISPTVHFAACATVD